MKQALKNEADLLSLINKMQDQLGTLERKIDTLINRSTSESRPNVPAKSPVQNNARPKYTAVCADCNKECTIPFKPSGDRPVYCQDCFSRRKVIRLSKISVPVSIQAPIIKKTIAPKTPAKPKKKAAASKKTVAKNKTAMKKTRKK
jgi:CxxC-x17-CxxC domain-containing protein